jgi:hypothetical protein
MAARLRLKAQREGGVAPDLKRGDMVHLDRDLESHGIIPVCRGR